MFWDRELQPYRRLDAVAPEMGLRFAAACIDRSAWRFDTDYPTGHDELRAALSQLNELLWSGKLPLVQTDSRFISAIELVQNLTSVIDGYEDRAVDQPCKYIGYAAKYASCRAIGVVAGVPTPLDIANYAYLYTWYRHVPAVIDPGRHPGGILESDLEPYEAACVPCTEDIAFQVAVAQEVLAGVQVTRSELSHRRTGNVGER